MAELLTKKRKVKEFIEKDTAVERLFTKTYEIGKEIAIDIRNKPWTLIHFVSSVEDAANAYKLFKQKEWKEGSITLGIAIIGGTIDTFSLGAGGSAFKLGKRAIKRIATDVVEREGESLAKRAAKEGTMKIAGEVIEGMKAGGINITRKTEEDFIAREIANEITNALRTKPRKWTVEEIQKVAENWRAKISKEEAESLLNREVVREGKKTIEKSEIEIINYMKSKSWEGPKPFPIPKPDFSEIKATIEKSKEKIIEKMKKDVMLKPEPAPRKNKELRRLQRNCTSRIDQHVRKHLFDDFKKFRLERERTLAFSQ